MSSILEWKERNENFRGLAGDGDGDGVIELRCAVTVGDGILMI